MEETKNVEFPLLYCKTNIIESINKVLKNILISKKLCSNWIYIVKKIINYSHLKSKTINKVILLNKNISEKISNTNELFFSLYKMNYYLSLKTI